MSQSQEWFFGTVALVGSWYLAYWLGWRGRDAQDRQWSDHFPRVSDWGRYACRPIGEPRRPQFWDQEVEEHPSVRVFYDTKEA